MSDFLETLKRGMQEAQQRVVVLQERFNATQAEFQTAHQKHAIAQAEFQNAQLEFQAFQTLVSSQSRKENPPIGRPIDAPSVSATVAVGGTTIRFGMPGNGGVAASSKNVGTNQPIIEDNKPEGNKTQAVRLLLQQHPNGMTPGEMWSALQGQLSNRVYLYSILKRLKDRGDIRERRGKYYCIPKLEESQNQEVVQ